MVITSAVILGFFKRVGAHLRLHWKKYLIGLAALIIFIWVAGFTDSCGGSTIDQEELQKINSAERKERLQELDKNVRENLDTLKTVDGRNVATETSVQEREAIIANIVREGDRKVEEAKRQGRDVTSEELECVLLPEKCS